MSIDSNGFQIYMGEKRESDPGNEGLRAAHLGHDAAYGELPESRPSRKHADLTCDVEQGHLSASLCHLANVSYRTGRKLTFRPDAETFVSDGEANKLLTRDYRAPFVVPASV